MVADENGMPAPPSIDVWNGVEGVSVHYYVRHPWQWVMRAIATASMVEAHTADDLPTSNSTPVITPATPATRRRRDARKFKGPSTLKIEIVDTQSKELLFAVHGSSPALDGLEDKDELVRTLQRCRCDKLNLSPPAVLLSWDCTLEECVNVLSTGQLPVLKENSSVEKFYVLKEPMGSQGKGIFFVRNTEEIHRIIDEHRQRAIKEPGFLDNLIAVKQRIPSWVLQAEVYPSLLIRDRRKFHVRTYVVVVEKLHTEDLVDIVVFNRHEIRIAGLPVEDGETERDRLSHITNGAQSNTTERIVLDEVDELKELGLKEKLELFAATTFCKHFYADIQRRVSVGAQQEPTPVLKYALAGLDLMITEQNRIYLLEVNSNPAAPREDTVTESFKNHLTGFFRDLVDLVIGQPSPNFLSAKKILRDNGVAED